MALRVAIQMDPIESIDIGADSTFVLGLEAQARGPGRGRSAAPDCAGDSAAACGRARPLTLKREKGNHFTLGDAKLVDLSTQDVILMRQDPPFDMAYITATHILELLPRRTLVVNDPAAVRNAPEKLFVTRFDGLMPPTLITSDREQIAQFRAEHRDIIVKPLYGNGGAGVFHVGPDDENLGSLLELFTNLYREPIVVQRYIPNVRVGDKRIILIDGEPAGAILRVPKAGEARSNLHVGGTALATKLDSREQEICAAIGPTLRDMGLVFAGIDVIGGFLTEINVTSPTGLQEVNRFDGVKLEAKIWDAIDRRLAHRRAATSD
jgi:glutathione synthase